MLDARTDGRTDGHKGDFILCPMLCIALHWTHKNEMRDTENRNTVKCETLKNPKKMTEIKKLE